MNETDALKMDIHLLLKITYGLCLACKDLSPGLIAMCKGQVEELQEKYKEFD